MKSINEKFTDEEFLILKRAKGSLSWRDWLLQQAKKEYFK